MLLPALILHMLAAARARIGPDDRGQTTAEYALVLLGGVAVAGLLIAWATQSHAISRLFDVVVERIVRAASA
jgi:hypothetical protein